MRSAAIVLAFAGFALLGWVGSVSAGGSTQGSPFNPSSSGTCAGSLAGMPACDAPLMRQRELYGDVLFHVSERARRSKEWDKETALKESQKIIDALSVPCELADAERAGGGKVEVDGRLLDVKVYEAACHSGTGYFLVSQPPQKSLAISCFAADAAHAADMAQGAAPDEFVCTLSGNSDVKVMAASVLKGAGTLDRKSVV